MFVSLCNDKNKTQKMVSNNRQLMSNSVLELEIHQILKDKWQAKFDIDIQDLCCKSANSCILHISKQVFNTCEGKSKP